jgi:general secretion pathway protein K
MMAGPPEHDRGLALVAVLWVVALLGLLAHTMLREVVVSVRGERNTWSRAVMERDAETGLALALLWLTDPRETARWWPGAGQHEVEFDGARISLTVEDELGKIDLNTADDALLTGLLVNQGIAPEEAAQIRERIVHRRTATAVLEGTRFESIEELAAIEGIDATLLRKLAPAITVHSQARWIDPAIAPLEALRAQPGVGATEAERIVSERGAHSYSPPSQWGSRAYAINIKVLRNGATLRARAVLRPTPEGRKPYLLLAWSMNGP